MYNSSEIAEKIKSLAKTKNIVIKNMLIECGLNKNALSSMLSGGSTPKSENLAKIADYLDCSVDYLLGRTDVVEVNRGVKIIVDDGRNVTPYMAAYDGSSPNDAKMSLKTIKQLDDEN